MKMVKSILRNVQSGGLEYRALMFWCPGCEYLDDEGGRHGGLHMLPIKPTSVEGPSWDWDGNLDQPTLSPSILTRYGTLVCHSFLKQGIFEFLGDCTHQYANMKIPIPDLPQWVLDD